MTLADGAYYSLESDSWEHVPDLPIEPRWGHVSVLIPQKLIVWGGASTAEGGADLYDGAVLSLNSNEWRPIRPPSGRNYGPRLDAVAVGLGSRMIVGGGALWGSELRKSLVVYDAEQDLWDSVSLDGNLVDMVPSEDEENLVVITGRDDELVLGLLDANTLSLEHSWRLGMTDSIVSATIVIVEEDQIGVILQRMIDGASLLVVDRLDDQWSGIGTQTLEIGGIKAGGVPIIDRANARSSQEPGPRAVASDLGIWIFDPYEDQHALSTFVPIFLATVLLISCSSQPPNSAIDDDEVADGDGAQEFNRAVLEEYDGPIELEEEDEEALERGPDAVADCMIRQGFEYIAETQPVLQGSTQVPADDDLSRGWVETYGFGGSTLVFGDEQTAFLAGYDSSSLVEAAISSPNQSY